MSVATFEKEMFGEQLTVIERAIGGFVAVVGAIGHAALGAAAAVFLYLLLFGL